LIGTLRSIPERICLGAFDTNLEINSRANLEWAIPEYQDFHASNLGPNLGAFDRNLEINFRANLEWAIPEDHDFHEPNLGPNLGTFDGNLEINSRANLGANLEPDLERAIPEDLEVLGEVTMQDMGGLC
jgi:hypothetical protein